MERISKGLSRGMSTMPLASIGPDQLFVRRDLIVEGLPGRRSLTYRALQETTIPRALGGSRYARGDEIFANEDAIDGDGSRAVQLRFASASEVQEGLEAAVAALIKRASSDFCSGILVTRHDPGSYTVALDSSVPFGETQEVHAAT